MPIRPKTARFQGSPGAPGVGLGEAYVLTPIADLSLVEDRTPENIEAELVQFDRALAAARQEIRALGKTSVRIYAQRK